MDTKEFSKNPDVKTRTFCTECKHEFDLTDSLREEPMPIPFNTVVEGVIVCPKCGHRTHSYYMPESLRHHQTQLKRAVIEWQEKRTTAAFSEYRRRLKVFQNNFDRHQKKYSAIFKKEAVGGGKQS